MMVSPGVGSQLVDRLEKSGMVERIADFKGCRVRKVIVLDKSPLKKLTTEFTESTEKNSSRENSVFFVPSVVKFFFFQ